ncbi:MAG: alpha-L-fucosidase [Cyclobacteriaceae bacterium]
MKYAIMLLTALVACGSPSTGQKNNDSDQKPEILSESKVSFDQRMDWWRDAGFGMFIHWGPYAVPAGVHKGEKINGIGEWIMERGKIPVAEYEQYAAQFNPTDYDAREWVRIAKEAGMKYIVITSKHHDGFALWDSKVSDYDVMDFAPIKRDLLAELKQACDEAGIKLGLYHSIMDWHHPDAQAPHFPTYNTKEKMNPNFPQYYSQYLKPQVKEIIENYDPEILWFDGEWIPEYTHEQGIEMYNFIRDMKPSILVNNRVDKGRKGMMGMNSEDQVYVGDFGTPEQEILEETTSFDWEACMTLNDTWGFKTHDNNWKSAETLVHNIVDIAAKGGNYLLNVGPTAEGLIPVATVDRLAKVGEWMAVNGEIVYSSRTIEKFKEGEATYYVTDKTGKVSYVIATEWPGEQLEFSHVKPSENSEIIMLGSDQKLNWATTDGKTTVDIPLSLQEPGNRPCKYAWVLKVR